MQMPTGNAFIALLILFVVFIWYQFFFAPKKGAAIAAGGGKEGKKWHFYIWSYGIFAMTYLYFFLNEADRRDKRSLILLTIGYVLIFFSAICIDAAFDLKIR
jgi:hypothetical protein